jgi:tripartite-type tricarboxylate transporter receptor subunit TctC
MSKWLGVVLVLCMAGAGHAQSPAYPTRPITIVVTAAAGGVTDVLARAIGQRLSETWRQQVVIENRGGAAHLLGATSVAKAPPDGHTLMVAEAGTFVTNPLLYDKSKLPFDIDKDIAPITGLARINHALVAHPTLPARGIAELIELAKKKPGEISYGTTGIGSGTHLTIARLESLAGAKFLPVHYRGATPALNDVVAGHIMFMLISVSSAVQPFREGKVKMLGIGSLARLQQVPDVPTLSEGLPGYRAGTWFGLATTGGTPPNVVLKINAEVKRILADPEFRDRFLAPQMFEPMVSSPTQFSEFLKAETRAWAQVIGDAKLKLE